MEKILNMLIEHTWKSRNLDSERVDQPRMQSTGLDNDKFSTHQDRNTR